MALRRGYLFLISLSNPKTSLLGRVNQASPRGLEYLVYQVLLFLFVLLVLLLYLVFALLQFTTEKTPRREPFL